MRINIGRTGANERIVESEEMKCVMVSDNKGEKPDKPKIKKTDLENDIEEQIRDNEKLLESARKNASHSHCPLCESPAPIERKKKTH